MTVFHALQIALLVAIVALVVERLRALCYRGAVDAAALRRALVRLLRSGRVEDARRLAGELRSAVAVEPAWALLDPELPDDDRMGEMDERLLELEVRATARLRALRICGSVASALGFLGAAIEIHWIFTGDHGLMRLQAGLVETIGMSHAVLSIALGISTSSFALGAWSVLRKHARDAVVDGRRLLASIEEALENRPPPAIAEDT